MTALLRAELIKHLGLRLTWVMLTIAIILSAGLTAAICVVAGSHGSAPLGREDLRGLLAVPGLLVAGIVFVLGVLSSAGEYRHHTITASLLVTPRRGHFLTGKYAGAGVVGVAFAAVTLIASYVATAIVVLVKDLPVDLLTGDAAVTGLGVTIAAGLFALAGAGLGALVRSEALALITAVAWWFVIEGLLPDALREPGMAKYLPAAAARALIQAGVPVVDGTVAAATGGLLVAAYVAAITVPAVLVTKRRDVG
jgi:ABC-2 type transport system permease protein